MSTKSLRSTVSVPSTKRLLHPLKEGDLVESNLAKHSFAWTLVFTQVERRKKMRKHSKVILEKIVGLLAPHLGGNVHSEQ